MRRTKIVCTMGPATENEDILRELMLGGMNVARQNFSHGTHASHKEMHDRVVKVAKELNLPVATMLDTKGPEVRLRDFRNGKAILMDGDVFVLCCSNAALLGTHEYAAITYANLYKDVTEGTRILIDDGNISLVVKGITGDNDIECIVEHGGVVSNHKSVNVPNVKLSMSYISAADDADIRFAAREGFDFVAASFVTCAADIIAVRKILEEEGRPDIRIIAKIENREGVDNIDEIIAVSDGIMVARGDMGVEVPFEEIPQIQKMMIKKCAQVAKPVIVATQMLESMVKKPRPTRAEISDVANAIYDGADAIMLSGETAAGDFPVQAVQAMASIAEVTEGSIDYKTAFGLGSGQSKIDTSTAIAHATVSTAFDLDVAAIITVTKTGNTANTISRYRPQCPIVSCTTDEVTLRQLSLSWGVAPLLAEERMTSTDDLIRHAVQRAQEAGYIKQGDLVVVTAGVPLGVPGTTNLMKVHTVDDLM